ncbi:hypothetical protein V1508DRAFT_442616 [Lipomyces doorenjongii]|uniref:uncharacterized protein n=1 Tax=Lipomyces doorenjongii TaxID=383834 RepID=UPI0034CEBA01
MPASLTWSIPYAPKAGFNGDIRNSRSISIQSLNTGIISEPLNTLPTVLPGQVLVRGFFSAIALLISSFRFLSHRRFH